MYREFDKESKKSGKPRLLTAIATAAGQYLLKQGYDIPVLCKWLDMVNIMSYVKMSSINSFKRLCLRLCFIIEGFIWSVV